MCTEEVLPATIRHNWPEIILVHFIPRWNSFNDICLLQGLTVGGQFIKLRKYFELSLCPFDDPIPIICLQVFVVDAWYLASFISLNESILEDFGQLLKA